MASATDEGLGDRIPVLGTRSLPGGLPAVSFGVAVLVLSPLVWLVFAATSVPIGQLIEIGTSDTTVSVTQNTIVLVAAVTALSILLAVPLAVLTVQTTLPFRRFWTLTSALPLVIPSYIGAFTYDSAVGIDGLFGTVVVLTLFTYPYVFLTTRATLISFDGTMVEAARSLNASRLEAFRRVTLPQLLPGIAAGAVLVALYTLSDFGTPTIMGYDVFTRTIWNDRRRLPHAAVRSLLLLAMAGLFLMAQSRIEANGDGAYVTRGARSPGTIRLGLWTIPALAFCLTIAVLCLAVPVGVLLQWMGRLETTGMATDGLLFWGSSEPGFFDIYDVYNSVALSAGAAMLSVILAVPVAYLAARSNRWSHTLPDRLTYLGYATPGIVLGFALLWMTLSVPYLDLLYRTPYVLVFAYVVRFLPQAVGSSKSSMLQVDPKYVEAARSLGYGSLGAFRRVVVPQIAPGIAAGGALVFLTAMKELPATLMLNPLDFDTIVTHVWQVQKAGLYGRAAVPSLVLIGVSALSMAVILGRERSDGTR